MIDVKSITAQMVSTSVNLTRYYTQGLQESQVKPPIDVFFSSIYDNDARLYGANQSTLRNSIDMLRVGASALNDMRKIGNELCSLAVQAQGINVSQSSLNIMDAAFQAKLTHLNGIASGTSVGPINLFDGSLAAGAGGLDITLPIGDPVNISLADMQNAATAFGSALPLHPQGQAATNGATIDADVAANPGPVLPFLTGYLGANNILTIMMNNINTAFGIANAAYVVAGGVGAMPASGVTGEAACVAYLTNMNNWQGLGLSAGALNAINTIISNPTAPTFSNDITLHVGLYLGGTGLDIVFPLVITDILARLTAIVYPITKLGDIEMGLTIAENIPLVEARIIEGMGTIMSQMANINVQIKILETTQEIAQIAQLQQMSAKSALDINIVEISSEISAMFARQKAVVMCDGLMQNQKFDDAKRAMEILTAR